MVLDCDLYLWMPVHAYILHMVIFQNYVSHWSNFIYDKGKLFTWVNCEEYIEVSESVCFKCLHPFIFPLQASAMALTEKVLKTKIFQIDIMK